MRIIEEHHKNEREIICENCGSKLAYYDADYEGIFRGTWETVKTESASSFGGIIITERRSIFHIIECPICNHTIKCDEHFEERTLSR